MANMSYCRFENTSKDLKECADNWDDDLSGYEAKGRIRILRLIGEILDNCGIDFDQPELDGEIDRLKAGAE